MDKSKTTPQTAATFAEMDQAEQHAKDDVENYTRFFINFPTAQNFDLVAGKLRDYQTAWMNGRKRL